DGRVRRPGLDPVAGDLLLRVAAEGGPMQPSAPIGERLPIELAEGEVLRDAHARDAGVPQRLLGQAAQMVLAHLLARRVIGSAPDPDRPGRRQALTGEHLDQLALAVSRYARDADDLAGAHRQRQVTDGGLAGVILHPEALDLEAG